MYILFGSLAVAFFALIAELIAFDIIKKYGNPYKMLKLKIKQAFVDWMQEIREVNGRSAWWKRAGQLHAKAQLVSTLQRWKSGMMAKDNSNSDEPVEEGRGAVKDGATIEATGGSEVEDEDGVRPTVAARGQAGGQSEDGACGGGGSETEHGIRKIYNPSRD